MKSVNTFTGGKMDKSTDQRFLKQDTYIDASNVIVVGNAENDAGVIRLAQGTTLLSTITGSSLSSTAKCIGAKKHKDKIYMFFCDYAVSTTDTWLIQYDTIQLTTAVLFKMNIGSVNGNNNYNKIRAIDITGENDELLYFTDGVTEPKKVNIQKLLVSSTHYATKEDMYVIKRRPATPTILPIQDNNVIINKIKDSIFMFSSSYEYEDGEVTPMSSFTNIGFITAPRTPNQEKQNIVANDCNSIKVTVYTGDKHVKKINIYAIDKLIDTPYLIYTVDKAADGISDNTTYDYIFTNSEVYTSVSADYYNMKYSDVPKKTSAQKIINNRLIYGKYTGGYNLDIDTDYSVSEENAPMFASDVISDTDVSDTQHSYDLGDIFPLSSGAYFNVDLSTVLTSFTLEYATQRNNNSVDELIDEINEYLTILFGEPRDVYANKNGTDLGFQVVGGATFVDAQPDLTIGYINNSMSLKSGEIYKYTILYKDAFGREYPLPKPVTLNVSNGYERTNRYDVVAKEKITINHEPPTGAATYQILRTKINHSYESFQADEGYGASGEVYIRIPETESQRVTDDFVSIELYGDADGLASVKIVSEIKRIDRDTTYNGKVGDWIVIEDTEIAGYSVADYSKINGSVFYVRNKNENKVSNDILFYAVSDEYPIVSSNHTGDVNQVYPTTASELTLHYGGDVFITTYVNGTSDILPYRESYVLVNGETINTERRGAIYSENAREINRYASITWSEPFVEGSSYNGLSTFNLSLVNYADLKKEYGNIEVLDEHIGRILIVQHDRVGVGELDRVIMTTATGSQQVGLSDDFFEKSAYNAYNGVYGCQNYETYTSHGFQKYFTDKKRNAVLRLSNDGMTPINDVDMREYFRSVIPTATLKGCYDPKYNSYVLNISGSKSLLFSEISKGWMTSLTLNPDMFVYGDANMYAVHTNKLYVCGTGSRGIFLGTTYYPSISISLNAEPLKSKVFDSLILMGSHPWSATITTPSGQSTSITSAKYEKRENGWFASIPMNTALTTNITGGMDTVGLGYCEASGGVTFGTIVLPSLSPYSVVVGSSLFYVDGGSEFYIGDVISVDVTAKTITVGYESGILPEEIDNLVDEKFVFCKKNSYIEGENMRGEYAKVVLTREDTADAELVAVVTNYKESKL